MNTFVCPCFLLSTIKICDIDTKVTNVEYITYHTPSEELQTKDIEKISSIAISRLSSRPSNHAVISVNIIDYVRTSPVYKKMRLDKEFNHVI